MKKYYLYNEDVSGYQKDNNLPFSDLSEFVSGNLDKEFEDETYFNSLIKKAYKGQYFINETILDTETTGNISILEDGYYRIILKANDYSPSSDSVSINKLNNFWLDQITSKDRSIWNYNNYKLQFYKTNIDTIVTTAGYIWILSYRENDSSPYAIIDQGIYKIYDQVIVLYRETSPKNDWIYYNTVRKKIYGYKNLKWNELFSPSEWRGELDSDNNANLADPKNNWTYFNTVSGSIRKYNSSSWGNVANDGAVSGLVFMGEFNSEETNTIQKKYVEVGVIDLSFLNTENLSEFWQIRVKCTSNEIFYGKIFENSYLKDSKELIEEAYISIGYDGVEANPNSEYKLEYSPANIRNSFSRRYYDFSGITGERYLSFRGFTPFGAGGYYEKYIKLAKKSTPYSYIISSGYTRFTSDDNITASSGSGLSDTSKSTYTFQYNEALNGTTFYDNVGNGSTTDNTTLSPRTVKTPLRSVGPTVDLFGKHEFVKPTNGYVRINFLGAATASTITSRYIKDSGINILEDDLITIPRNNMIKYHFIYNTGNIQVSRGIRKDDIDIHVYKDSSGNLREEQAEQKIEILYGGRVYSYFYTYKLKCDLNKSYVIKRETDTNGITKIIEKVPITEVSQITRDSNYSESMEFLMGFQDYEFIFKQEPKKFRVYYDKNYVYDPEIDALKNNAIISIKVNGNEITSSDSEQKYYEVGGGNFGSDDYWATIEIQYNKPSYGLVRDFTAFSSKLVKLLDMTGASWTYSSAESKDIIKVKMERDIYLDLSHQGQLYALFITYVKENNTLDIGFGLDPIRLKLGQVPYTIQDTDRGGIAAAYFTEGEKLWLDWGFTSDDSPSYDFSKKIYVNELLSSLPPEYTLFPINQWPYNQAWNKDTSLNPHSNIGGIDIDFYRVTDKNQSLTYNREKPFQVLNFRMPAQTFTIKLVVSYLSLKFNFHRDDLGIIDPWISATEFTPGDIIKMSFTLDEFHGLSSRLPTNDDNNVLLNNFQSSITTYQEFLKCINNSYDYRNPDGFRKRHREILFSFCIIDKNFKSPMKINKANTVLNFDFKMSVERAAINGADNLYCDTIQVGTYTQSEYYQRILKLFPEEVSIYFIGGNSDIDMWLSPSLIRNKRQEAVITGQVKFLKIEQTGYYALLLAGSRCGNGGDGGTNLGAGATMTNQGEIQQKNNTVVGLWGSDLKLDGQTAPSHKPHPSNTSEYDMLSTGKEFYFTTIENNTNITMIARAGGDGAPGWIGGKGGNGGNGTGVLFTVATGKVYITIGLWHYSKRFTVGDLPGLVVAGGKVGGASGDGGNGFFRPGGAGVPGGGMAISGAGVGTAGVSGELKSRKVDNFYSSNIFLKKGTIILIVCGKNGENGLSGDNLFIKGSSSLTEFNSSHYGTNASVKPDGSSGTPGLPTVFYTFPGPVDGFDTRMKLNGVDRRLIISKGLSISELSNKRVTYNSPRLFANGSVSDDLPAENSTGRNNPDMYWSILDTPTGGIGFSWKIFTLFQCVLRCMKGRGASNNRGLEDINDWIQINNDKKKLNLKNYLNLIQPNSVDINYLKSYLSPTALFYGSEVPINANNSYLFNNNILSNGEDYVENNSLSVMGGKNPEELILLSNLSSTDVEVAPPRYSNSDTRIIYYNGLNIGQDTSGAFLYFIEDRDYSSTPINTESFKFN
jgi:hypothetical protein